MIITPGESVLGGAHVRNRFGQSLPKIARPPWNAPRATAQSSARARIPKKHRTHVLVEMGVHPRLRCERTTCAWPNPREYRSEPQSYREACYTG